MSSAFFPPSLEWMELNKKIWRKSQLENFEFNLALGQNQKGMNNILFSRYSFFFSVFFFFNCLFTSSQQNNGSYGASLTADQNLENACGIFLY